MVATNRHPSNKDDFPPDAAAETARLGKTNAGDTLKSGTQFPFDLLVGALTERDATNATSTLRVLGNPGGRIHLRNGGVVCVESAGSPGPDALLLRTGRISNIGETELHVIAMSTPIDPIRLLQETSRRISSLLALKHPLRPHRDRVAPSRGAHLRELGPVRGEILAHATGRRTTRDIAFATGRSVYPVTIESCRMVADGLMTVVPGTTVVAAPPAARGATAPETAPPPGSRR